MTRLIFFPVFIPLIYIVEGFLHKTKHTMTGISTMSFPIPSLTRNSRFHHPEDIRVVDIRPVRVVLRI